MQLAKDDKSELVMQLVENLDIENAFDVELHSLPLNVGDDLVPHAVFLTYARPVTSAHQLSTLVEVLRMYCQ
ncbi:hypothetical protein [Planctopirus limnophila]|nr:hypothetical protein [Planctopirus limnophila]